VKFAFKCPCLIKRILKCNAKSIGFVRVYWLGLDAGQVTAVSMRLGVKYQYRLVIIEDEKTRLSNNGLKSAPADANRVQQV
jgi:hypothetical protein